MHYKEKTYYFSMTDNFPFGFRGKESERVLLLKLCQIENAALIHLEYVLKCISC